MRNKKPKIGDVYEIKMRSGLAYIQYSHDSEDGTQLVRVLPGVHASRPLDIVDLVRRKEVYFAFTILTQALRRKEVELVSNESVPESAKLFPTMRKVAGRTRDGKVTGWVIGHGLRLYTVEDIQKAEHVQDLTPQQTKLSIASIRSASTLGAEIERGWTPERNEEFEEADRRRAELQPQPLQQPGARFIDHYLYFSKKYNAERAAHELHTKGWSVEIRMGADGKNWLALVKQPAPIDDIEETREYLERLASELSGEYDGWGAALEAGAERKWRQ